jgi:hypothetical protein
LRAGIKFMGRAAMKFLCLAYGDEKDWKALTKEQQDELLAQDEILRNKGTLMAAVEPKVITVRAWDGKPSGTNGAFGDSKVPLAGFSVMNAADMNEVIQLVAGTPCARCNRSERETAGAGPPVIRPEGG